MKGNFKPKNPQKYVGDPKNIIFRSSYELKFFNYIDNDPRIIQWASEEMFVRYMSPVDNKPHKYYPDVVLVKRQSDGTEQTIMIEIKPASQTRPPEVQKQKTRRYITEVMTWGVNQAKWKAAEEYCNDRKWKFMIMTEKELGIKF